MDGIYTGGDAFSNLSFAQMSKKHETLPAFARRVRKGFVAATYSSRDLIARVPLALRSLTAVFGMGTGVTFSLTPPQFVGWTPVKECDRVS